MITTESAFYYDFEITESNKFISFNEGGGEIIAELRVGKYTLTGAVNETVRAMNDAGSLIYTGSMGRNNRIVTISASANFSLLGATMTNTLTVLFDLGFINIDYSGANTYDGNSGIGSVYRPQFRLQSYVDFDHNQQAVDSTVNISANGQVELVRFGVVKLMECNIDFATDIDQGYGGYIRTDGSGVSNLKNFMEYLVNKGPIEFIPDIQNPGTYKNCVLESTPESKDGVNFKLKEKFSSGLIGYYSTGLLTFREVTI
jgi:hypothetical protein